MMFCFWKLVLLLQPNVTRFKRSGSFGRVQLKAFRLWTSEFEAFESLKSNRESFLKFVDASSVMRSEEVLQKQNFKKKN